MTALAAGFRATPLAHRGYHDRALRRPENSRAAFAAAVRAGYGIELDVQRSSDDVAMAFHDDGLERLTGYPGRVNGLTAVELGAILLSGSDEGIPTLDEVLALVTGQVPLLIEIKDQDGALGPGVGPLERAVAGSLAGYPGPVAVMSFNPHSVALMAELAPQIPRGLTTCDFASQDWPLPEETRARLRQIPDYDAIGASFVSHDFRDLDRARIADLKARGATLLCWTVRSPDEETAARRIAHNITFEGYAAPVP